MAGPERSADPQWEATVADLITRRLEATTAAERDLAGQLLLGLLTGQPAEASALCPPRRNDISPAARARRPDASPQARS